MKEFARLFGVKPEEITEWLAVLLHAHWIRPSQWSKWTNDTEPISEAAVRLYLEYKSLKTQKEREEWQQKAVQRRAEKVRPPAARRPTRERRRAAG